MDNQNCVPNGDKCYGEIESWEGSVKGDGGCIIKQDGQRQSFQEGEQRLKGSYRGSHMDN